LHETRYNAGTIQPTAQYRLNKTYEIDVVAQTYGTKATPIGMAAGEFAPKRADSYFIAGCSNIFPLASWDGRSGAAGCPVAVRSWSLAEQIPGVRR
jgi:hypothetical protein